MNSIGFINVALAVSALLVILFSMARSMRHWHCELMVGDVLVVLTYLLIVHTEWIAKQYGVEAVTDERAWRLFGMVVLVNLLAHTIITARNHKRGN